MSTGRTYIQMNLCGKAFLFMHAEFTADYMQQDKAKTNREAHKFQCIHDELTAVSLAR